MIHAPRKTGIDWGAVKNRLAAAQQALAESSTVDEARMREVFHQRAVRLAAGEVRIQSTASTSPVLAFQLCEETYGIDLRYVAQVFPAAPITPVPGAQPALLGVANLQGLVHSVLDLRRLLGLPDNNDLTNHYILLLRHGERRMGLQVEQVDGVRRICLDELTEVADDATTHRAGYLHGVTRDKLIVLNGEVLF